MNRRRFLRTVGGAAVAGSVRIPGLVPAGAAWAAPAPPMARVAVFWEPGFPAVDVQPVAEAVLREATSGMEAAWLGADAFTARVGADVFDVVVTPYGSAVPRRAWPALVAHLGRGGHWINIGGAPCAVPVDRDGQAWRPLARQTALHARLGVTQAPGVRVDGCRWSPAPGEAWASALLGGFSARVVRELYVRFTGEKDFPDEDGSSGPRDALIRPLVLGRDVDGVPLAAPFVVIDRVLGEFAGGRWVFATGDGAVSAPALRALLGYAMGGGTRLTARPSFACYDPGETPAIAITLARPLARDDEAAQAACRVTVVDSRGTARAELEVTLSGAGPVVRAGAVLPAAASAALEPGLYRVDVEAGGMTGRQGLRSSTGFWIKDEALLAAGPALGVDEFALRRGGKPFPVTGSTYMASDVQRAFLLEPNPWVWDQDLAAMSQAGVNLVRTGIWTGWTLHMPDVDSPNEGALRALDAFMLTARRHGIPVIFTVFAFLPEAWGGANPYLDPRAVEAQKVFVTSLVQRFRGMRDVIWDLINEPSFSSSAQLWFTRPNGDQFEERAWEAWLESRVPGATREEREARLQQWWRLAPGDSLSLPVPADFEDAGVLGERHPLKAADYRLFAQETFARWAADLAGAVRAAGGGGQLITVGQDEGGTYERPSNLFLGPTVDLTSVHTWWLNDDLLWDSIVTRRPGAPNLVQETGVMFNERADGLPWRTEDEVARLLERKLALAIGAGGAGYVQWLWHANPYLPSDNEAAIGLLRADGTAKPELEAWRRVTGFVRQVASSLDGREPEPVVMIVPQSHLFSVRNAATEATRRAVRAMHYHCRVAMGAAAEYDLAAWRTRPALALLPCPRLLTEAAWSTLLSWVEQGTTLAVTGPFDADEHELPTGRMTALGLDPGVRPVAAEEHLEIDGREYRLGFRGEKLQRVETSAHGAVPALVQVARGSGRIMWAPQPIELAEAVEPTAAFYGHCLRAAGVQPLVATTADPSILIYPAVYRDVVLYTVISEAARDTRVRFAQRPAGPPIDLTIAGGRAALVLVDRRSGRVLQQLAP